MRIGELIEKKKRGKALDRDEICFFVEGCVDGSIPDYQASALLMAIWFSGMEDEETSALTLSMAESGDQIDLTGVLGSTLDKHSTGGVGDSTTLVVAPIVAACGGKVAKMSGRGLGHTGGTLDKLESIPGFRIDLSRDEFIATVNRCGLSIVGQTGNLVPADKRIYALRDVTGTIDSVPLIASSIMSKKLAAGASTILLDVKWGTGAFMKRPDEATKLARAMVEIGVRAGRRTVAFVTDMNQPLGRSVGNSLDVAEAIRILKRAESGDLLDLSVALATELLVIGGVVEDERSAAVAVTRALDSGSAVEQLACMIEAQSGDPRVIDDPSLLPIASNTISVRARKAGMVESIDAEAIGLAAQVLGAGRIRKEDSIDPSVGIVLCKRLSEPVAMGEEIAQIYANSTSGAAEAEERCVEAMVIGDKPPETRPLIVERIVS